MEMWDINDSEFVKEQLSEAAAEESDGEVYVFENRDETASVEDGTLCYMGAKGELYENIQELSHQGHLEGGEKGTETEVSFNQKDESKSVEDLPYRVTD